MLRPSLRNSSQKSNLWAYTFLFNKNTNILHAFYFDRENGEGWGKEPRFSSGILLAWSEDLE